jgi:hypothetical protein
MTFEQLKHSQYYEQSIGHAYEHSSLNHHEDLEYYHRPLARMQHAYLHGVGIARGLAVRGATGTQTLTVEAGLAIDDLGRIVVLANDGTGDIGADPPNGESNEQPVPVTLGTAGHAAGTYVLTIQHHEALRYRGYELAQFEQVPWLRLQPVAGEHAFVDEGIALVLALIEIAPEGAIASITAGADTLPHRRQLQGVQVGSLSFRHTSFTPSGLAESEGPYLTVQPDGGLRIDGSGPLRLNPGGSTVGIGIETPQAALHIDRGATNDLALLLSASGPGWGSGLQLRNEGVNRTYGIYAGASGQLHFADVNAGVDRLLLGADGNVGVGSNPPTMRLDVQGQGLFRSAGWAGSPANIAGTVVGYDAGNADGTGFVGSYGTDQGPRPLWLYGSPVEIKSTMVEIDGDVRIHGADLCLDGRSGGNRRALVDWNDRQLVINFANDYSGGVHTPGDFNIGGQLAFGAQTKQHINLWRTNYGIGVQHSTMYFRTGDHFAWYRHGVHNNAMFNAGGGELMLSLHGQGLFHSRRWFKVGGEGRDFVQLEAGGGNGDRSTLRFDTKYLSFWSPPVADFVVFHGERRRRWKIPFGKRWVVVNEDGLAEFRRKVTIKGPLVCEGDVTIRGRLNAPKKEGFVVDKFINNLGESLESGDVVVIGKEQQALFLAAQGQIPVPEVDRARSIYDTRVCGIVVEAHATSPAMVNAGDGDSIEVEEDDQPLDDALLGASTSFDPLLMEPGQTTIEPGQVGTMATLGAFAHCKVDADIAPIEPGDLLTTSPTPGHAQKVLDRSAAVGAILGKALEALSGGKGKIAVFVNIQ